MRLFSVIFYTALMLGLGFSGLKAQVAIPATGGDISGNGGSVSYTIGQVNYQAHSGTSGSVIEGVQQPYEISIVTSIARAEGINLLMSAFPNPTPDYLILDVKNYDISSLSFQIFGMNGNFLQSERITDIQTRIDLRDFSKATYCIKVMEGNKEVKVFKVIKQ